MAEDEPSRPTQATQRRDSQHVVGPPGRAANENAVTTQDLCLLCPLALIRCLSPLSPVISHVHRARVWASVLASSRTQSRRRFRC